MRSLRTTATMNNTLMSTMLVAVAVAAPVVPQTGMRMTQSAALRQVPLTAAMAAERSCFVITSAGTDRAGCRVEQLPDSQDRKSVATRAEVVPEQSEKPRPG